MTDSTLPAHDGNELVGGQVHTWFKIRSEDEGIPLRQKDLPQKVQTACDYYQSDAQRPHLVWYYDELMSRLKLSDLETDELAALVAVLVGAHSRKLAAADGPEAPGGVFIDMLGSPLLERRLRSVAN